MQTQIFQKGIHQFTYTDQPLYLPRKAVESMLDVVERWQTLFPAEPTFTQTNFGVPALWIRFDGVLSDDQASFRAYEIQDGSGWAGYTSIANKDFKAKWDDFVYSNWPSFGLVQDFAFERDDELWLQNIDFTDALKGSDPLLVRYYKDLAQLPPEDIWNLTTRSVAPFRQHNNKSYGVGLGWWKYVRWDTSDEGNNLPWDTAFVLKPLRQWGSTDIMLWTPDTRRGRATRTQVIEMLRRRRIMYLQPFIQPTQTMIGTSAYNVILRPFFAYDLKKRAWIPLGGVWTGRPAPNLRIHGATDAISGPLLLA